MVYILWLLMGATGEPQLETFWDCGWWWWEYCWLVHVLRARNSATSRCYLQTEKSTPASEILHTPTKFPSPSLSYLTRVVTLLLGSNNHAPNLRPLPSKQVSKSCSKSSARIKVTFRRRIWRWSFSSSTKISSPSSKSWISAFWKLVYKVWDVFINTVICFACFFATTTPLTPCLGDVE